MCIRPGRLTRAYLDGKRKRYLRPLSLFFLLNVVFFLTQGLVNINTYNSTLNILIGSGPDGGRVRSYVVQRLETSGESYDQFKERYDGLSDQFARTIVFLQVPMFAVILLIMYPRTLLYDQLILSTHFYAFTLLLNILLTVGIWAWLLIAGGSFNLEWPIMALLGVYLIASLRNAHGSGWVRSVVSGAIALVGYVFVLWVYRYLVFAIVMTRM